MPQIRSRKSAIKLLAILIVAVPATIQAYVLGGVMGVVFTYIIFLGILFTYMLAHWVYDHLF